MSTINSSTDHLTLNADGASKDIKFQANGVEKASISSAGAFTSTTIDATKLTGNLPAISGASLTNLPGGGKVLQVVQFVKTDQWSNTGSWGQVAGFAASITPTSSTSKILVQVNAMVGKNYFETQARLTRDGSDIALGNGTGTYRPSVTWIHNTYTGGSSESIYDMAQMAITYLDSPSTTSAISYGIKLRGYDYSSGIVYINRTHQFNDDSNGYMGTPISTITLMEVSA